MAIQFSLKELLAVTVAAAIGFARVRLGAGIGEGLETTAIVWLTYGLAAQAIDIRAAYRLAAPQSSAERFGYQYAIYWRFAAAALLVACIAVEYCYDAKVLHWPSDFIGLISDSVLRNELRWFLVAMVLLTLHSFRRRRSHVVWQVLGLPAGALLALLFWTNVIAYLVHVAINSIDAAQSPRFADPGLDVNFVRRGQRFLMLASCASIFIPLQWWSVFSLPRAWSGTKWRRAIVVYALCLLPTMVFTVWLHVRGLYALQPAWRQSLDLHAIEAWILFVLLLLAFTTAATYRLMTVSRTHETAESDSQHPVAETPVAKRRYAHQRRGLLLLLALGTFVTMLPQFVQGNTPWEELLWHLSSPEYILPLLVIALALRSVVRPVSEWTPVPLSPGQFAVVWLAVLMAMTFAAPTLAAFGFAVWLSPWYRFI